MLTGKAQVHSAIDSFLNAIWYVRVVHKYLNFATLSKDLLHVFMYCDCVLHSFMEQKYLFKFLNIYF